LLRQPFVLVPVTVQVTSIRSNLFCYDKKYLN
jgi:hypothetical protein